MKGREAGRETGRKGSSNDHLNDWSVVESLDSSLLLSKERNANE
jgi:hypothetical protein